MSPEKENVGFSKEKVLQIQTVIDEAIKQLTNKEKFSIMEVLTGLVVELAAHANRFDEEFGGCHCRDQVMRMILNCLYGRE